MKYSKKFILSPFDKAKENAFAKCKLAIEFKSFTDFVQAGLSFAT